MKSKVMKRIFCCVMAVCLLFSPIAQIEVSAGDSDCLDYITYGEHRYAARDYGHTKYTIEVVCLYIFWERGTQYDAYRQHDWHLKECVCGAQKEVIFDTITLYCREVPMHNP